MSKNGFFISQEMAWLQTVLNTRVSLYFNQGSQYDKIEDIEMPDCNVEGIYAEFVRELRLQFSERLFLALSLAPYVKPQLFDCLFVKNNSTGYRFSEFGGTVGDDGKMTPTFNTFLFAMAGDDVSERIELTKEFKEHPIFSKELFVRDRIGVSDFTLTPSQELLQNIIYECHYRPDFSEDFPARRLTTNCSWADLIIGQKCMEQIEVVKKWLKYKDTLNNEWNMRDKLKKGYRVLFYGPSGTGKTFTASLLGKEVGLDVYCIDLSLIVSKYIGETEKNLSKIFNLAEGKKWILFFDEADALFGKRTKVTDSHDRYANQEVAFLLQRIEDYDGLVVLSTNLKSNIDEAFARRFQSVIRFQMPDGSQRHKLWKSTFSENVSFSEDVDLEEISKKYEISGGSILNVVQYCSLMALSRDSNVIMKEDIIDGIKAEYRKEGKVTD